MLEKTYLKAFAYFWPMTLSLAALIFAVAWLMNWSEPLNLSISFVLGATVSILLMSHNRKSLSRVSAEEPQRLARKSLQNYIFRYAFYLLILWLAFVQETLNVWLVFIGLFMFKLVLLTTFALAARRKDFE
jgi:hypothetical protein